MKIIKRLTLVVLPVVLALVLCLTPCFALNNVSCVSTSAKSMCVLDKDSGRILYSSNENQKLPMASTTKIMTAITVLQNCSDLNKLITVDDSAIGVEGTSIYLRKDEVVSIKDLLYGLMLRSGNDAAVALACEIGGDVKGFANKMNELATTIGAKNSHFANPHGLDDPNHYTTAYDLALITSYALNNPVFKEVVSTKTHQIPETNKSDKRYLTNKNRLLSSLDGCCGVKTGFTSKAGRCLVSACEREEFTTVCVVLNCGPMFEESSYLLNKSFEDYNKTKIIDKDKEIYNETLLDSNNNKLYLYTDEDFYYPIASNEFDKIKINYTLTKNKASEGEEVGKIDILLDNCLLKTLKLYTINKIDKLVDSNNLDVNQLLWEENFNEN